MLRTLGRDALIVLALLGALEITLRAVAPRYSHHLFDDHFTGGYPLERSPEGFRGTVPPVAKAPGEVRVMSVGDSVTMGTGVRSESTFAHALGPEVARLSGRPVTTINAGVEGWDLKAVRSALAGRWAEYRPDVVVVGVCGNMVSRAWIDRDLALAPGEAIPPQPRPAAGLGAARAEANRLAKRLCTPSFVSISTQRLLYAIGLQDHAIDPAAPYGAMLAHGWRQVGLDPGRAGEAWTLFERDLAALCAEVSARGARVVVTALPARFTVSERAFDNEKFVPRSRLTIDPSDRVRLICRSIQDRASGVEFVDALGAIRAERQRIEGAEHRDAPMYIQFDYTHLDEDGHRAVAGALALQIAGSMKVGGSPGGR